MLFRGEAGTHSGIDVRIDFSPSFGGMDMPCKKRGAVLPPQQKMQMKTASLLGFRHGMDGTHGTINTIHLTNCSIFQFVQRHTKQVFQHRPTSTIKMFGTDRRILPFNLKPFARVHAVRLPNDFWFFCQLPRPELNNKRVSGTELANGNEVGGQPVSITHGVQQ